MVKESTKTKALTGPRQLKTMVPEYDGVFDTGAGAFPNSNGWFSLGLLNAVYFHTTIDVNLALDDLTMFPQAAILQDPGVYLRTTVVGAPVSNLQVVDIVSVKLLNPADLVNNLQTNNALSGMIGTSDDFNQIIMGTWRMMASNTNLGLQGDIQTTIETKDFSSASPFAQDTLHCYRFLIPTAAAFIAGDVIASPASRFIIQVIVGKEEDLPYMMRLKNSYELQQL